MGEEFDGPYGTIHRHHATHYLKPVVLSAMVAALGVVVLETSLLLAACLWAMAAARVTMSYLDWRWTIFWITADHRLAIQKGLLWKQREVISPFGRLSGKETPVVGGLLDVGSVTTVTPGGMREIKHIAKFHAFYEELTAIREVPPRAAEPPLAVILHLVLVEGTPAHPNWVLVPEWPARRPDG